MYMMWTFWRATREELRKQLRAKEVVQQVERVKIKQRELILFASENSAQPRAKVPVEQYKPGYFRAEMALFEKLAPNLSELNKNLLKAAEDLDRSVILFESSTRSTKEKKAALQEIKDRSTELDMLLSRMESSFQTFQSDHAEQLMLSNTVDFVYLILLAIPLVSAVIFITLVFIKLIQQRITVLVKNAELIAEGKPLLAPLKGNDEFAAVDEAFRHMNKALTLQSEELRLSEAKVRTVIESMPLGLITADTQGVIQSMNETAAKMLSLDLPADATGKNVHDYFEGTEVTVQSQNTSMVLSARRADNSSFPSELLTKPYNSPEGERLLIIFSDITEQEKLRSMREEFIAVISHEIRTPLTSVRAFLHLLEKGQLGEVNAQGKTSLKQMEQLTLRLVGLVNELIEAGKIELGHLSLHQENFFFQELVDEAVNSVSTLAKEHSITLEVTEDDAELFGDRVRTVQVLVNLAANAIKYSPAGSRVSIRFSRENSNMVRVTVADSGSGIAKDQIANIFNRFARVAGNQPRIENSSGLGLYIAKDIVERQGGTIGVESAEGKGSTFWFTIPTASGASFSSDSSESSESSESTESASESGTASSGNGSHISDAV